MKANAVWVVERKERDGEWRPFCEFGFLRRQGALDKKRQLVAMGPYWPSGLRVTRYVSTKES